MDKLPIAPGELLRNELRSKGIKQKDFAKQIGIPYTMLNKLVNGNRPMKADMALLLEKSLGKKAEDWMKAQSDYSIALAKTQEKTKRLLDKINPL